MARGGGRGRRSARGDGGGFGGGGPFGAPPGGGAPPWGGVGWSPWTAFLSNVLGGAGRGRRARRGDVRAGVLVLLAEQPRNGYQMMQELEQRSRGAWRPSSGSIYPALAQLEDEGLVQEEKTGSGRTFHLTAAGKSYVAKHKDDLASAWDSATESEPDPGGRWEFMALMKPIAHAALQVAQSGTQAQCDEAQRVLSEARRSLYRILAEDEDDEDAP